MRKRKDSVADDMSETDLFSDRQPEHAVTAQTAVGVLPKTEVVRRRGVTGGGASQAGAWLREWDWQGYFIYIALIVMFACFSVFFARYGFLTGYNLLNLLRQTSTITIMAMATTFVIAAAEIDLSLGSVEGLASVVAALGLAHYGLAGGILGGLGVGVGVGVVNGLLVTVLRIPSFLTTLAMLTGAQGLAMWISGSNTITVQNVAFVRYLGGGDIGPVPSLIVWSAVAVVLGYVGLRYTRYGKKVLATGGSRSAAQYTGIHTQRIRFSVMLMSGVAAGFAGMLLTGRLDTGQFSWGSGDELTVIAAVILGGTSLFGGRGRIVGSLVGSLFLGLIDNGLLLANVGVAQEMVLEGVIIVVAVALAFGGSNQGT